MQDLEVPLAGLDRRDVVGRIWHRDHTVWKPGPEEVSDRLGWLDVTERMRGEVAALEAFAEDVQDAGYLHVVLLGMGGSSLGPLVLSRTFGRAAGRPEFIVLDSTVPSTIRLVTETIRPLQTLFLVSSKSGGTIEPNALYKHFRGLVEHEVGKEKAGANFVAITDQGSSLEGLGLEKGFRRVFLNPSDIGGRYSVLSFFGLVPAALIGLDLATILDRAERMRKACASEVPARDNPGAWLGVAMGAMALSGRDKLTFVTSPSIDSFGLWAEQLIAESTGKEGRGIVPVAGEPVMGPTAYGEDRLFVYLRVEGDDNSVNDAAIQKIESAGQPVVRLELSDVYDLGAEFFRWQFATAVAGSILGINPFDQPNVELAKKQTEKVLEEYRNSGRLPREEATGPTHGLLEEASENGYLAIMAFINSTEEIERSLEGLRGAAMERYRVATTLGYGPRFLHSTGQLHKGGPESGLFLQLTADHVEDMPIPGEPYTFGVLADAQALGDLRALEERGRRVLRVHLGTEVEAGIERLVALPV